MKTFSGNNLGTLENSKVSKVIFSVVTSVPDLLVRGIDPDPSIILLSSSKNSKKNLDPYCFVTSFGLFIFEK
jgi:hypothetical protein